MVRHAQVNRNQSRKTERYICCGVVYSEIVIAVGIFRSQNTAPACEHVQHSKKNVYITSWLTKIYKHQSNCENQASTVEPCRAPRTPRVPTAWDLLCICRAHYDYVSLPYWPVPSMATNVLSCPSLQTQNGAQTSAGPDIAGLP